MDRVTDCGVNGTEPQGRAPLPTNLPVEAGESAGCKNHHAAHRVSCAQHGSPAVHRPERLDRPATTMLFKRVNPMVAQDGGLESRPRLEPILALCLLFWLVPWIYPGW